MAPILPTMILVCLFCPALVHQPVLGIDGGAGMDPGGVSQLLAPFLLGCLTVGLMMVFLAASTVPRGAVPLGGRVESEEADVFRSPEAPVPTPPPPRRGLVGPVAGGMMLLGLLGVVGLAYLWFPGTRGALRSLQIVSTILHGSTKAVLGSS